MKIIEVKNLSKEYKYIFFNKSLKKYESNNLFGFGS